eukprot:705684-Amphidinium_carterae.1
MQVQHGPAKLPRLRPNPEVLSPRVKTYPWLLYSICAWVKFESKREPTAFCVHPKARLRQTLCLTSRT